MMKTTLIAVLMATVVFSGQAISAEKTAQQQKMTVCNQQAGANSLKGDSRKSFMSNCLKKDSKASTLTAQQQKMKDCNASAKSQKLAGTERKTFMSQCLKKKAS